MSTLGLGLPVDWRRLRRLFSGTLIADLHNRGLVPLELKDQRAAIGQEPVRYVRNVFKYYVAYKLAQQTETERAEAIEQLKRRVADDDDRQ